MGTPFSLVAPGWPGVVGQDDNQPGPVALVIPANLVSKPEAFDDAAWTKTSASVTADNGAAPNGLTVADKLTASGSNGRAEQTITIPSGASVVVSEYFKKSNVDWTRYRIIGGATTISIYVNLTNGALGFISGAAGSFTAISAQVVDAGSGWYRLAVFLTTTGITSLTYGFQPAQADAGASANTDAHLAWGAELHVGTTLEQYVPPTGTYTLAAGRTISTVSTPNGDSPTEGALASHRFRHHTRVAVHGSRVWVAWSSGGTNEDAGGQMVAVASSTDGGDNFGSPVLVVPAQSTFSGTGASYDAGSRVSYPRLFVVSGADLYLVSAIDNVNGSGDIEGGALVALKCNSNGTVGTLKRISSADYVAQDGAATIDYDADVAAALFSTANIFGSWGGSSPGNPASDWTGWMQSGGIDYAEPTTAKLNKSGTRLVRLWRRITTNDNRVYAQYSTDSGATFGSLSATGIPDSPSATAALRQSNGKIAVVGNPVQGPSGLFRDPLYLMLFDSRSGRLTSSTPLALRQAVSGTPTYAGTGKAGGAQYPGLWESGGILYVSYALQKETIGMVRLPIL